jgi:hypothetical protein
VTASEHDDGLRLVTFEITPDLWTDGVIDQDRMGYQFVLAAAHSGVDLETWEIDSMSMEPGFVEDRPALFMVTVLRPKKADVPPAQPLRVVGE